MDRFEQIIGLLPGLEERLKEAGFEQWVEAQRAANVEGRAYVVLGGDRLASRAEAMLSFALERGLVSNEQVQQAASRIPLPDDVTAVEIDRSKGDK
jgi:hypothetical protein